VNQKFQIGSKEGAGFFLDVAESRLALRKDDMRCVKHDARWSATLTEAFDNDEDDDHAANFT
jgi:hypothetical protein